MHPVVLFLGADFAEAQEDFVFRGSLLTPSWFHLRGDNTTPPGIHFKNLNEPL